MSMDLAGWVGSHRKRIPAAVGELAILRVLTIIGRTEAADFIAAVRSPLTKLAVSFMDPTGRISEWSPTSLSASLSHVASSLESLTRDRSDMRLVAGSPDSLSRSTQFCVLRSLTLHNVLGVRQLPVLLKVFPNLNPTLHLTAYTDPDADGPQPTYDSSTEETRMENGAAQERRSWKRLERLICNAETTFTLNLRCQIGLMIIHSCSHISVERRYLVESLREHPPARLNLEVTLAHGIEASLSGMIPPEAAAALTHLTLCIITQDPTAALTMRWDDFWCDTLLPTLERLRCLTHLRFVFHCEAWTRYHQPGEEPVTSEDCKFLDDLRPASFDLTAVASTIIADAIPSLRYFFLTNSACVVPMDSRAVVRSVVERWRESRAWRIAARASGDADFGPASGSLGRKLVQLHNDVAETILQNEDLILSEHEEASVMNAIGPVSSRT